MLNRSTCSTKNKTSECVKEEYQNVSKIWLIFLHIKRPASNSLYKVAWQSEFIVLLCWVWASNPHQEVIFDTGIRW